MAGNALQDVGEPGLRVDAVGVRGGGVFVFAVGGAVLGLLVRAGAPAAIRADEEP